MLVKSFNHPSTLRKCDPPLSKYYSFSVARWNNQLLIDLIKGQVEEVLLSSLITEEKPNSHPLVSLRKHLLVTAAQRNELSFVWMDYVSICLYCGSKLELLDTFFYSTIRPSLTVVARKRWNWNRITVLSV
jgi:hypothetical protein